LQLKFDGFNLCIDLKGEFVFIVDDVFDDAAEVLLYFGREDNVEAGLFRGLDDLHFLVRTLHLLTGYHYLKADRSRQVISDLLTN